MKIRRKHNTLLNAEILSPDTPVAELDAGLTKKAKMDFVNEHNAGLEMLQAYQQHRDSMHILNVVDLLEQLEEIYGRYDQERFIIKRRAQ